MGYGSGDLGCYLQPAKRRGSAGMLRGVMARNGVTLQAGDSMLDWGRLREGGLQFRRRGSGKAFNVWGCDVHPPSIEWAKNHLSPPFIFFNSLALPQLPFSEADLQIHLRFLGVHVSGRDAQFWLLELRRVLRPDVCLVLTIHDEKHLERHSARTGCLNGCRGTA